ncbi:hypothetical protein L6164_013059 [Bauhinia variegata]|uniref:Uncharacterized protein n=1 Tax=Bauhinia variegata TaxID=167791 RepID=A0ACB9PBX3_BAUVA|nr:hypothetical protein L6164_013059 [Bauhinia variegata]
MACYIQITLLMENGEVAYELSPLISNISDILKVLKCQHENCKQQIDEMEVHLQDCIAHFEDAFSNTLLEMSELMKSFLYSRDGGASLIDGSTKSTVNLEVLKKKHALFLLSDLDINAEQVI